MAGLFLWPRSYLHRDRLSWEWFSTSTSHRRLILIDTRPGQFRFQYSHTTSATPALLAEYQQLAVRPVYHREVLPTVAHTWSNSTLTGRLGFYANGWNRELIDRNVNGWGLIFPDWSLCIAGLLFPTFWLLRRHRLIASRRTRQGLCPACGYDLRASPTRCPECGRAITLRQFA